MTEFDPESAEVDSMAICLHFPYENDEDLLEIFSEFAEVEFPKEMGNRIIEVDDENPKNSIVLHAESMVGPRVDTEENAFFLNMQEGDTLHVHATFDWELYEGLEPIFNQLLGMFEEVKLAEFNVDLKLDDEFGELNFPLENSEIPVVGIRFEVDGSHYIFQQLEDEGQTSLRHILNGSKEIEPLEADFIDAQLLNIQEFIARVRP